MALLGRRQDDEDDERGGGESLSMDLDDRICPTCGRALPPWVSACPDDGSAPVDRSDTANSRLPEIPAHLLEGLDGPTGPDDDPDSPSGGD